MKKLEKFIATTISVYLNENKSDNNKTIGYHITLSKNDTDIKNNGIKSKNGKIYVWLDEYYADWFRETQFGDSYDDHYNPSTKYTLNLSGFDLIRDKEAEDMSNWSSKFGENEFGEAYIIEVDKISPSRIINIEKY